MLINLHKLAATTPKVRAAIQASDAPARVLAERYGTTEQTIYKWRRRNSVHDRSNTPHRLQTKLTPEQEAVAVTLRKTLMLPIDDLLVTVREYLTPDVSRSGLDRCLRRHGVGNLREMQSKSARTTQRDVRAQVPGHLHVDIVQLPQTADGAARRYLFLAIDRATRWIFVRLYDAKTAASLRCFLHDLELACPVTVRTILAEGCQEFSNHLFGLQGTVTSGQLPLQQMNDWRNTSRDLSSAVHAIGRDLVGNPLERGSPVRLDAVGT
jgi:hypothetical protein